MGANRSLAAKKGWETRRKNIALKEKRSLAAKKGWETRRKNQQQYQSQSQELYTPSTPDPSNYEQDSADLLPAFDDVVAELFINDLEEHQYLKGAKYLLDVANRIVSEHGISALAAAITDASAHGINVNIEIMYHESKSQDYAWRLIQYMPGSDELESDEISMLIGDTDYDEYFDEEEVYS